MYRYSDLQKLKKTILLSRCVRSKCIQYGGHLPLLLYKSRGKWPPEFVWTNNNPSGSALKDNFLCRVRKIKVADI